MKVAPFLLPLVTGLNVLLTSSDSWVSKNSRYLYRSLVEEGHTVVYVGPYYFSPELPPVDFNGEVDDPPSSNCIDGGDFCHLLPAHQKYYRYVRKLKTLAKGAKKVIFKKDSDAFDFEYEAQTLVRQNSLGQDPMNKDFWYVNGSPLESLAIAFSEILPKYLPGFKPELVIVGPNEGIHLSTSTQRCSNEIMEENLSSHDNQVEAMVHLAQLQGYPTISVSMEDNDHVYYQNEDYFNVEAKEFSKLFKDNYIAQNVKFVSTKVTEVVFKIGHLLNNHVSLNINFPSTNQMSSCFRKGGWSTTFEQVVREQGSTGALGKVVSVPTFLATENELISGATHYYKVSDELATSEKLSTLEVMRLLPLFNKEARKQALSDNEDFNKAWDNQEELTALAHCNIAVSVNHISKGNNMDRSFFDILKYL